MSGPKILVSNGTCYSSAGNKLDNSFIPCGNDAFGHQTCCGAGDNCLANNACFGVHGSGYGSYLTYMAGCTDADYTAASCPDKHGIDQPWIALTLCDNSDGEWAPCSQSGDPATLQPGSFCSCTDAAKTTVAFSDANTLAQVASLPRSTGQSIAFQAGHTPSGDSTKPAPSVPSTTAESTSPTGGGSGATSAEPGRPSSSTAASTQTGSTAEASRGSAGASASPPPSSATDTGASPPPPSTDTPSSSGSSSSSSKIGIGIGVGVGSIALLSIALLALLYLWRRKLHKHPTLSAAVVESAGPHGDDDEEKNNPAPLSTPRAPEIAGQPVSEAAGRAADPWTLRSELEGTNYFSAQNANAAANPSVRGPETQRAYVAYRPPPPPVLQEQGAVAELPGGSVSGETRSEGERRGR